MWCGLNATALPCSTGPWVPPQPGPGRTHRQMIPVAVHHRQAVGGVVADRVRLKDPPGGGGRAGLGFGLAGREGLAGTSPSPPGGVGGVLGWDWARKIFLLRRFAPGEEKIFCFLKGNFLDLGQKPSKNSTFCPPPKHFPEIFGASRQKKNGASPKNLG